MATFPSATLALLHQQVGHITSAQLAESGISRTARRRLVTDGVLEHPFKSVYRLPGERLSIEQRFIGISLAHPAGFLTGCRVGSHLGLRKMLRVAPLQLCLPHGSPASVDSGVTIRQSTKINDSDRRRLDNGMIVASWPRLAFDLAADLPPASFRSVIEQLLQLQHCTPEELGAIARRLCHPRRPGSELFAATLMARAGRRPVESDAELRVLEGLLARGIPIEPQHRLLQLRDGRTVRIDLAVPAVRWAVEIDVHPDHIELAGTTHDKRRDRQMHLIDWEVERVSPLDLLDLDGTLDELEELYRLRVRRAAA